jgi:hypothetical protein
VRRTTPTQLRSESDQQRRFQTRSHEVCFASDTVAKLREGSLARCASMVILNQYCSVRPLKIVLRILDYRTSVIQFGTSRLCQLQAENAEDIEHDSEMVRAGLMRQRDYDKRRCTRKVARKIRHRVPFTTSLASSRRALAAAPQAALSSAHSTPSLSETTLSPSHRLPASSSWLEKKARSDSRIVRFETANGPCGGKWPGQNGGQKFPLWS